jgi:hypothetical protein
MLRFVPVEKFKLLSGGDALTSYRFNHKIIDHQFCSTCGIKTFAAGKGQDGGEIRAVNVRCLDDIDVTAIPTMSYDGKSK